MKKYLSKNPLFFVFVVPASIDYLITVFGQGHSYWSNFAMANEAAPIGYVLLAISPYFFLFVCFIWLVFLYRVVKILKEPYNFWLSFLLMLSHAWGSSSWIAPIFRRNGFFVEYTQTDAMILWVITILYFSLVTLITAYNISLYRKSK